MGPLGFVNWHLVNIRFRFLMWLIALALAIVVLAHLLPRSGYVNLAGPGQGGPPARTSAAQAQAQPAHAGRAFPGPR